MHDETAKFRNIYLRGRQRKKKYIYIPKGNNVGNAQKLKLKICDTPRTYKNTWK